ncbi:MAG: Nuclease [Phycisphaerales bacterium]|nr:Nuclease [Phycisphaerales bacterium]
MRLRPTCLLLAFVLLTVARPALAWNRPGHMVVGAIAYDVLAKDHPKALAAALAALRQHPQYDDVLAKRLEAVPEADRDRYLFMVAARWADDVRDKPEYHHGPWHYVDVPYVPPAEAKRVKPPEVDPNGDHLLTALKANEAILRAADADPKAKAVAVCWVMHLVGDAHQPLHAVSLYAERYPEGDRGGNSFHVRAEAGGSVLNLHSLWDGLILGSQTYRDAANAATELRNRPAFSPDKLKRALAERDPKKWVQESYHLAIDVVYRRGDLRGSTDRSDGPVLPGDYLPAAKAVAERRVVLAGYRLAAELDAAFGK